VVLLVNLEAMHVPLYVSQRVIQAGKLERDWVRRVLPVMVALQ